ncbi:tRNA (adenosine(37)-N6)-threonylcarbamoyltransferase complex ATPase subunit type 1 TsaE [Thioclava litoralis]|uniref:tRNA threonylcarbamoyladenosine biosynthesis protein TsaE n=1 Tax=Thioclava litoralis TaxID=3076557 RepID=A0ABZ1DWN9_9RHOB|nr:tRNA (adenosine(37)-N6)-threonylcarbamoyltransferase complex ATPase subunit type 1 TsaE [Thioclava sp. FTW29]
MSADILTLPLVDPDATARLGRTIAPFLKAGDVLLLDGQIGAGKTHFSRALIQHRLEMLGLYEDVPSPTFTLVQVYEADPEIWHSDLYRLSHPDDVLELGLDEAFQEAICLVEWPDRLGDLAPASALTLAFSLTEEGASRQVVFSGDAAWAARLPEMLEAL